MATINGTLNDDTLAGTAASDTINGLAGKDTLTGGGGHDTLDGGIGADSMVGGGGNDVYIVDDPLDITKELGGGGTDLVKASIDGLILAANVENLTLTGLGNLSGTGNTLNNYVTGNGGANLLVGDKGNDTLDGGAGADTLSGGTGNDVYFIDSPTDLVQEGLGGGKDTVHSTVAITLLDDQEVETVVLHSDVGTGALGNKFANSISIVGAASVSINGFGGNDTLTGGANSDALGGHDDNDLLFGLGGGDKLYGGEGKDTLNGGEGNDFLDGENGVDVLIGGKGDDNFIVRDNAEKITELANQGYDKAMSVAAAYTLAANVEELYLGGIADSNGTGNTLGNYIRGNNSNNRIDGAGGHDVVFGLDGDDTLIGGAGNDELHGDVGADQLIGGAGNDEMNGNAGADQLIGGTGNDVYTIDDQFDTVVEKAGGGIDEVSTTVDKMTLADNVEFLLLQGSANLAGRGNALSNGLFGNLGDNALMDDKGNDTLDGGFGNDTMQGGKGNDTYFVDNSKDVVAEMAGQGYDTVRSNVDYTLKEGEEIEALILASSAGLIFGHGNSGSNIVTLTGTGAGFLYGEGGNDTITGSSGGDHLIGGGGNDRLIGGDGADDLSGGTGKDAMIGGKGDDEYSVDDVGDKITELANQGTDSVGSSLANYTLGANLENLGLDDGGLNGTGNALNNMIFGNDLGNILNGAGGRDLLFGNDGNDTLKGGAGFDILEGNGGADVMHGEADAADVFRYQISSVGELAALGGDTIIGFRSQQDKIELTDLFGDFGIDPDLAFTGGYVYLLDKGADTDLVFDRDGAIGANVPVVLATIVNADVVQFDVVVQGFVG